MAHIPEPFIKCIEIRGIEQLGPLSKCMEIQTTDTYIETVWDFIKMYGYHTAPLRSTHTYKKIERLHLDNRYTLICAYLNAC